jgi:hypothetical protein
VLACRRSGWQGTWATPVCGVAYVFTYGIFLPGMKLFLGDHGVWYGREEPPHGPNNPTYEPTTTTTTPPTHPGPTRPDTTPGIGSLKEIFLRTHTAWARIYTGGNICSKHHGTAHTVTTRARRNKMDKVRDIFSGRACARPELHQSHRGAEGGGGGGGDSGGRYGGGGGGEVGSGDNI